MIIDKYKQPDGSYIGPEEVYYEDAESFILSGILGFCGCGMPEDAGRYIRDVLKHIEILANLSREVDWSANYASWTEQGKKLFASQGAEYFAYYVLSEKELTEHGGSVPGWLTEKGKNVLNDLTELYPE